MDKDMLDAQLYFQDMAKKVKSAGGVTTNIEKVLRDLYASLPVKPIIVESNGEQLDLKEQYERILGIEKKITFDKLKFKRGEFVLYNGKIFTVDIHFANKVVTIIGLNSSSVFSVEETSLKRLWFQKGDKFVTEYGYGLIVDNIVYNDYVGDVFVLCRWLWGRSHLPLSSTSFEFDRFTKSGEFTMIGE